MLIDWFTIIAQVINFLVLVWLLKHYLYRPILNAIDDREKRISTELADADKKKKEAEQQREIFEQKNIEFDKQQTERLNKGEEEAKTERLRLLESVRKESDELRHKLDLAMQNEQQGLQQTLSQNVREEVFSIVRKTLKDLAETSLESSMTAIFIKRLSDSNKKEKADLKSAFQTSSTPLIVHTAFVLPKAESKRIETALKEMLGDDLDIQFAVEPKVVSGIEINAKGQKIAWSIDDYLAAMTKSIDKLLQPKNTIADEKSDDTVDTKNEKKAAHKKLDSKSKAQDDHEKHT